MQLHFVCLYFELSEAIFNPDNIMLQIRRIFTMHKKHNFTLVEILVATGIIAILAGIGFAGYSFAMTSGREKAAKATIFQISTALDTCYNKLGFYPACKDAYGTIKFEFTDNIPEKITFGSTEFKKSDSGVQKKFFDLFTKTIDIESLRAYCGTNKVLCDSWGNEIQYQYPGAINKNKYDLISPGADGKFGSGEADTPSTDRSKYLDGQEWICDDIANF